MSKLKSDANSNLVSVITATFNDQNFIADTYASLAAQDHKAWEWCVTDDASDDSTVAILSDLASRDPRINFASNPVNAGAGVTRNCGISRSSGRYLAFLDSDDAWEPDKLSKQLEHIRELGFSFTGFQLMDSFGNVTGVTRDTKNKASFTYEDMLRKKATLGCSTVMLDRAIISDIAMPVIRRGQDYLTWLGILRAGFKAHLLPEPLTRIRKRPSSLSSNKIKKAFGQWQIYTTHEKLPVLKSAECFVYYAYRALVRVK